MEGACNKVCNISTTAERDAVSIFHLHLFFRTFYEMPLNVFQGACKFGSLKVEGKNFELKKGPKIVTKTLNIIKH